MKLKVADIYKNEVLYNRNQVDSSCWNMDSEEIKFVDNIKIDCEFRSIHESVIVKGKTYFTQDIRCCRCLQRVKQDKNVDLFFSYDKRSLGDILDIDSDVRQEILLQLPMKPLCKVDCKGICPGCGINLNLEECKCEITKERSSIDGTSKA